MGNDMTFDQWCAIHLAIGVVAGVFIGAWGMLHAIIEWGPDE